MSQFANAFRKAGLLTEEQQQKAHDEELARAETEERANRNASTVACAEEFDEDQGAQDTLAESEETETDDESKLGWGRALRVRRCSTEEHLSDDDVR